MSGSLKHCMFLWKRNNADTFLKLMVNSMLSLEIGTSIVLL